ncbi:MAG: hypothetical protein ACRD1K_06615 [Acidimicrobiales bacterium]
MTEGVFGRARRRLTSVGILGGFVVLALPAAAGAASISVPGTVNLGSVPTGAGTLSAQMGTVTATASGIVLPSFVATVSSTDFTTGGGSSAQTIAKASISYWSGPVTASIGAQTPLPGQLTALQKVSLSTSREAFRSSGLVLSMSTSWNPTIVITIPAAVVAGTYTGTITHSVA